jgi:hypothetical protein
MSSGQGSVANNVTGIREVYRAGNAARNQRMRSHAGSARVLVLMAPGRVRTDLGGQDARLSIEESVRVAGRAWETNPATCSMVHCLP